MKRLFVTLATLYGMCFAAVGCGIDYGSIINDAHDTVTQSQSVIESQCGPVGTGGDVCAKLQEASVVATNLLQIADFALDTGTDLAASVNIAVNYAKNLAASVKTLLGIKAIPALARAAPAMCSAKDALPQEHAVPRDLLLHPLGGEVPK
jgi:hypothetical protein